MFVPQPKSCLKCGHVRTSEDSGSNIACPQCGAVYAKVEAAMSARSTSQAHAQVRVQADPHQHDRQAAEAGRRRVAHLVYLLYVIPIGLTALVGVVLAHTMGSSGRGSFVDSHFRWQITTFWIAAGTVAVLVVLTAALSLAAVKSGSYVNALATGSIGGLLIGGIGLLVGIWCIYRVARGWYTLFKGEAI